jgi:uncharacterized protein involved in exopolysaccharide biosynthesis
MRNRRGGQRQGDEQPTVDPALAGGSDPDSENLRDPAERPSRLLEHLTVLMRWWRFIVFTALAIAVLTAAITLLVPVWYRATTSVLPPKTQDLFGSLGSTGSVLRSLAGLGRMGQKPSAYNYFAILKSRTVGEAVIREFGLLGVYDVPDSSMEKALKELASNVSFEEQPDEYITLEVLDRDPDRAAAMANFYVEQLNVLSIELATQEARSNREFIQRRLEEAWADLHRAEDSLRAYQEKAGVIITPEQEETMRGIASLYAMKARKEVERAIARRTAGEDNPVARQLALEIEELNRKLVGYPEIGLQSLRLYRDVMIQQRIVEFLTPIFEQARIDEVKDIPVVVTLDRAVAPERKAKPQRALIVLVVTGVTGFGLVLLAFLMEGSLRRSADTGELAVRLRRLSARMATFYRVPLEERRTS